MGFWSVSINGNDIVSDLQIEYSICFSKYTVEIALQKLNEYARNSFDKWEYKHYIYSLAGFMWKHGILTEEIKDKALNQMKEDDLSEYAEMGSALVKSRKKVLENFSRKINAQQPAPKKIALKINPNHFLSIGDVCTLRLPSTGKYILFQKIYDSETIVSKIESEIKDIFPHFLLLDYYCDKIPTIDDAVHAKPVTYTSYSYAYYLEGKKPKTKEIAMQKSFIFYCEGKPFHFQRKKYSILGNMPVKAEDRQNWLKMDYCNLWRIEDEQNFESAIYSKYSSYAERKLMPQEHKNYDALLWLYYYDDHFKDLYNKYEQAIPLMERDRYLTYKTISSMIEDGYKNPDWM